MSPRFNLLFDLCRAFPALLTFGWCPPPPRPKWSTLYVIGDVWSDHVGLVASLLDDVAHSLCMWCCLKATGEFVPVVLVL